MNLGTTVTGQSTPRPSMAQRKTVLVVDDDEGIRTLVAEQLEDAGFQVATAADGAEMFAALTRRSVDIIVLDLNLPGEDGLSLCRRSTRSNKIPIIMLTARGEPIDRVIGLEVGADDYIAKPFEPRELLARVRSVLRRSSTPAQTIEPLPVHRAVFRNWSLDFDNRRLSDANGRVVMLSGSEFSLLKFLVEHANQILTREQLLTLTENSSIGDANAQRVADLQICRLRQKLRDSSQDSPLIVTVRNRGYVLAAAVEFQ